MMNKKEIRWLSKTDMLQIIHDQEIEMEQSKVEINSLKKKLNDMNKKINDLNDKLNDHSNMTAEFDSVVEASLKVNKVFDFFQKAADEYLGNAVDVECDKRCEQCIHKESDQ